MQTGVVISSGMEKSIVVKIERVVPHPVYGKYIRRTSKIIVHDANNVAKKGDVVYCDPPYVPLSVTSSFTSYTQDGFTQRDQHKLANLANNLMSQGVCVVISNHDTLFTREVYAAAQIEAFAVQRFISSKVNNRTKAAELLAVFA